jgi:translation initiation factor IF-1
LLYKLSYPCVSILIFTIGISKLSKTLVGGTVSKEDVIEFEGVVSEVCPSAMFRVKLDNGHQLLCTLSGKMRKNNINVHLNDPVRVEVSPYDISKGRITFRHKTTRKS